jgi:CheY-like chemotaxis protein
VTATIYLIAIERGNLDVVVPSLTFWLAAIVTALLVTSLFLWCMDRLALGTGLIAPSSVELCGYNVGYLTEHLRGVMVILLLEDEVLLAMDMADALTEAGHDVLGPVSSVAAALVLAEHRTPDLLLTNIDLKQGGSGIDAAREFLQRYHVPAVYVSGSKEAAFRAKEAALGLLSKPCRADQIVASVKALGTLMDGARPEFVPPGLQLFAEGKIAFEHERDR